MMNKKYILLIFLSIIIPLLWTKTKFIFASGEEGLVLHNLYETAKLYSSTWYPSGGGFLQLFYLTRIPLVIFLGLVNNIINSPGLIQTLLFSAIIYSGMWGVYSLMYLYLKDRLISTVGAVLYFLNPYSLSNIWGRGLFPQWSSFVMLPLWIYFVHISYVKKKYSYGILLLIISVVCSTTFGLYTMITNVWFITITYLLFLVIRNKENREVRVFVIKYFLILFVGWLFVHSWWILPTYLTNRYAYEGLLTDSRSNIESLIGISKHNSISSLLRLIPTFQFYMAKSYGEIYSSFLFKLIGWIVPVIAFFSLFIKKNIYKGYFIFLYFFSLFFCLGTQPPFGKIFLWVFKSVSYLQMYRNPYEKFGIVLMFANTVLFAFGLKFLLEKIKYKTILLVILSVVVFGVYMWPIWNGTFAGKHVWIKVPDYYKQASDWLKNETKGEYIRTYHIPANPGEGIVYNWETPYSGLAPNNMLFGNHTIERDIFTQRERYAEFIKGIYKSNYIEELEKYGIKYIILHNDLNEKVTGSMSISEAKDLIEKQSGIKKKATFGKLDIYEINNQYPVFVRTDDAKIVGYKRDKEYEYEVELAGNSPNIIVKTVDNYSPLWKVVDIDSNVIYSPYEQGGFNYYKINNLLNKPIIKLKFYFEPQSYLYLGTKISVISIIIVIILYFVVKKHEIKIKKG